QYLSHSEHDGNYVVSGTNYTIEGDLDEWQVSLIVAYQYIQALPYAGIKFSDWDTDWAIWQTDVPATRSSGQDEAEDNFGVIVGCDFYFERDWKLNLEGRFCDETAFSASLGYTF
ncbi:MAG: hypothetical protein AB1765_06210, partial [Candidatus Hydrogenedentota bacterium]